MTTTDAYTQVVRDGWVDFCRVGLGVAPELVPDQIRWAYYAGALAVFTDIGHTTSPAAMGELLRGLNNELNAFIGEVRHWNDRLAAAKRLNVQ